MNSKGRIAILAAIAMVPVVGGLLFQHRHPDRSALQPYSSGWQERTNNTGNGVVTVNFINEPRIIRGGPRFSYWTGGYSDGKQPVSPPTTVVAVARHSMVQVEVKAEAQAPGHAAVAEEVAREIDAATSTFWPGEQVPVAVELHQTPPNSRFEFARKIMWREGAPFHLTLFLLETQDAQAQARIAVHELYHVLATRWQLGSKSRRGIASPWLGSLYEEVTASLLADCSRLKTAARLELPQENMSFALGWKDNSSTTYKGSLDARAMTYLLDPDNARKFRFPSGFLDEILRRTAMLALRPEEGVFVAGSDGARQLMDLCHKATADPWHLEGFFRNLIDQGP